MQPDSLDLAQRMVSEDKAQNETAAFPPAYTKPRLECLGTIARVTLANINGNQFDTFGDFRFS